MTKHAKNLNHLQAIGLPRTMAVEIPLPLLEAFGSIESSFFELCIDSGQQVLQAMMEQDREDLCVIVEERWNRNIHYHALILHALKDVNGDVPERVDFLGK